MLERLEAGDFYILCPDNDVPRDARRAAHPLGGGRHRREPPGAVALAPRLRRGLRGLRQGYLNRAARRRRGALLPRPFEVRSGCISAATAEGSAARHAPSQSSRALDRAGRGSAPPSDRPRTRRDAVVDQTLIGTRGRALRCRAGHRPRDPAADDRCHPFGECADRERVPPRRTRRPRKRRCPPSEAGSLPARRA